MDAVLADRRGGLHRDPCRLPLVWFRNSVRGAVGLAIAVSIAQKSGLQHSFWVVLGTLSVLRSNALGTGRSVLSALAGTAVGIVIGAAILIPLNGDTIVLWGILPVAVLVGAYAPRVISFAAGQAAFTVVILVLFNIIAPTGWKVGLLRIEDVAVGFAISLGVGLVFWPRGRPRCSGRTWPRPTRGPRTMWRPWSSSSAGWTAGRTRAGPSWPRRRRCTGWTTRSASTWPSGPPSGLTRSGSAAWSAAWPRCCARASRWPP